MTSLPGKTLPLILACATAAGCSFVGIYTPTPETLNRNWSLASIARPYDSNRYAVHDGSSFKVHHGASCASANRGESLDNAGKRVYGIGVEDSISFPTGFDQGTVFLNGWRLRYRDGDHQVFALLMTDAGEPTRRRSCREAIPRLRRAPVRACRKRVQTSSLRAGCSSSSATSVRVPAEKACSSRTRFSSRPTVRSFRAARCSRSGKRRPR